MFGPCWDQLLTASLCTSPWSWGVHIPAGRDLEVTGRRGGWPEKATGTGGGGLSAPTVPSNCPRVPRHEATCRAGPRCLLVLFPRGRASLCCDSSTWHVPIPGTGHNRAVQPGAPILHPDSCIREDAGLNQRHSRRQGAQGPPLPPPGSPSPAALPWEARCWHRCQLIAFLPLL